MSNWGRGHLFLWNGMMKRYVDGATFNFDWFSTTIETDQSFVPAVVRSFAAHERSPVHLNRVLLNSVLDWTCTICLNGIAIKKQCVKLISRHAIPFFLLHPQMASFSSLHQLKLKECANVIEAGPPAILMWYRHQPMNPGAWDNILV